VIARSPDFRDRILRAYEYSCAVCGFDVRLGTMPVALEAAHIKWHQAGGQDEEANGLALCTLHHKLFDRGVFTLSSSMSVIVSEAADGTRGFQEWVVTFHDKAIRPPQRPTYYPDENWVAWHVREVFQGPGRYQG
jgi:putative restriction endonuclease